MVPTDEEEVVSGVVDDNVDTMAGYFIDVIEASMRET